MTTLLADVRFAIRSLTKKPAVPLAAIGTLALGIGATTAIFSTVNAALLRPLPYPRAEDLFAVRTTLTDGRVTTGLLSPTEIIRLNDPGVSVVRAAGLFAQDATLIGDDGTPTHVAVDAVSEGFFDLFGLPMTLGGFTHDQYVGNGPPVVIVSYRFWKNRLGSDPGVVGTPLHFAEITTTITGVAPRDFDTPHGVDFWFNARLDPQGVNHSFEGFIRLKPGTPVERLRSEMAAVMAGLASDFPASDQGRLYVVRPLVEQIVGDLSSTLVIVLSATALLLVLACVNVTNLLLARGAVRSREMAVRVALGASRGRIIRQLLTESVLLATAGAAAGLLVAYEGVRLLLVVGAAKLPRLESVPFDDHVLVFALGALVLSGLFVGFAPALRLAGTDVKTLLNESGRSSTTGRGTARWLGAMTVAEIALAVTLVAGAGWLVRSFANIRTIDPGFVAEGRLVFDVSLQGRKFADNAAVSAWSHDLFDRLRGLPGVVAVGSTSNLPLRATPENSLYIALHGESMDPGHPMGSRQRSVSAGFFDAMGIRILAGRDFDAGDRPGTAPVVVVNRTFARLYLAGIDPLTARFAFGYPTIDPRTESSVVGVVEDVRQRSLTVPAEPAFYTADDQAPRRVQTIVVSTRLADAGGLASAIRGEVRRTDPQMALEFQSASDVVATTLQRQQLGMTLMLLFGASAVALAAVGIYGVIAHASAERRGEVATRLALGATRARVFWLMMRQGGLLATAGAAIGLMAAYGSGRVVSSRLYEVHAADPLILGAATVLVALIALIATAIPAGRTARIDPVRALRPE
jgi:putative ABC transport system permease protein